LKIGLSYSRCVRDIVDGNVDINDVLVIVARTDFDPNIEEQWDGIWQGYHNRGDWSNPEWGHYADKDEEKFRDVSKELYSRGLLHQPRQFGAHPRRLPYIWLETVVADKDLERSPAIKDAWDKFQIVSSLKGTQLKEHNE